MPEMFDWSANANPQAPTQRGGKTVSGRTWGSHQEPTPGEYIVRYAGVGWRMLAGIVDYVVPTVLFLPIKYIGFYLFCIFIVGNSIVYQGKTGQSLGKRLLGMRLCYIRADQRDPFDLYEEPSVGLCAMRFFAHLLDYPFLYGLLIRPVFHYRKRTFADSVASTVVIRDDRVHVFSREEAEADRQVET